MKLPYLQQKILLQKVFLLVIMYQKAHRNQLTKFTHKKKGDSIDLHYDNHLK